MARVAIAGYGREGQSSYRYYRARGDEVVIVDEREISTENLPTGAEARFGDGVYGTLEDFGLVIRTPSLRPDKIVTRGKVWSQTNEFLARCPAEIIGVTGTKGKGTTCSLIVSILRAAGKTVHLVGNIGTPALDVLDSVKPDDIVVYELSSFQLWDVERSPGIAVVLMMEPDHLDVHASFEEYVGAKQNIRRWQTVKDVCLYHPTNELSKRVAATPFAGLLDHDGHATCEQCGDDALDFAARYAVPDDNQVYVKDGYFCVQNRQICSTDHLKLLGKHNLENACAAMSAVSELLFDAISDDQYAKGLENFTGLPHRLKFIREVNGVEYYDDNYSSALSATLAATQAVNKPLVLIAGGYDKGVNPTDFTETLSKQPNLKHVVLIGQTGPTLESLLRSRGYETITLLPKASSMQAIVEVARRNTVKGDAVVMSPGFASFDMFANFTDRGNQFVEAVEAL